ncbi:hypothetical protein BH11ACT4_BH11ACT4_24720 [soil metagenome]
MNTTTISDRDALELAHGRVPARPDLDPLADLLTAYRSAAIGPAPRPSAALSARLDLSATPIAMQRDAVAVGSGGAGTRRAASGLLGLGITAVIILGAASGAAAVVSAGSAGQLPPGMQETFDQVVSAVVPSGVDDRGTPGQGEAPGDSTGTNDDSAAREAGTGHADTAHDASEHATGEDHGKSADSNSGKGDSDGDSTDGSGDSGKGNSDNGNSGNGNSNSGNGNSDSNSGKGNSDSGNGNSGKGNSDSGNGNSGKGNSGDGNGNSGKGNG